MNVTPDEVCEDLLHVLQQFKVAATELAEKYHLTAVQMAALSTINRHDELPMGKMAEALHCDASNVTGIVDRLVAQGLVIRCECPQDRRAKALRLTDKGKDTVKAILGRLPTALGCDRMSADERVALHNLLCKFYRAS